MATVEMSFTPLPAHVRTARLVATAVARRSGVDEALLDEVRLAVGEACSRAVEAHQEHCPAEPVRVALTGTDGRFEVVVTDTAVQRNGAAAPTVAGSGANGGSEAPGDERPTPRAKPPGRRCPPSLAWPSSRAWPTTSRSRAPRPASASG